MTLTFGSYIPLDPAPACPHWCDGGDHTPSMHLDDWKCLSEYAVLTLTLGEPQEFSDDRRGYPHLSVFLEQKHGTRLPCVLLHDDDHDTETRLTAGEARELIEALQHQLDRLAGVVPTTRAGQSPTPGQDGA